MWNCLGIAVELSWKSCRSSTGTYFKMSLKLFKGFILIWFEVSYLKWQAVLTTKLFAHENHQRKTPRFTLESWSSFWLHDRTCLPNKAAFKSPALRRCAGNNLPVHEQQTKEPNQTRFTINQVYCIIIYIYIKTFVANKNMVSTTRLLLKHIKSSGHLKLRRSSWQWSWRSSSQWSRQWW